MSNIKHNRMVHVFLAFIIVIYQLLVNIPTFVKAESMLGFLDKITIADENAVGISSASELINKINNKPDGKFKLEKDIDVSSYDWTPMCLEDEIGFTGELDGQGHSIYGLYSSSDNNMLTEGGLFGHLSSAIIKNLRITINEIHGGTVGGIAASAYETTIQNCIVEGGKIYTHSSEAGYRSYCGGFVGEAGEIKIQDSVCSSKIVSYAYDLDSSIGGLIGEAFGSVSLDNIKSISDVLTEAEESENFSYIAIGGVIGGMQDVYELQLNNIIVEGSRIANVKDSGENPGTVYCGGLAGKNTRRQSQQFTYDNAIYMNMVKVTGNEDIRTDGNVDVGALIGNAQGMNNSKKYTIECSDCEISDTIKINAKGNVFAGGTIGTAYCSVSFGNVSCYSILDITSKGDIVGIGGMAGNLSGNTQFSNCNIKSKVKTSINNNDKVKIGGIAGIAFDKKDYEVDVSQKTYYNTEPAFGDNINYSSQYLIYNGEKLSNDLPNPSINIKNAKITKISNKYYYTGKKIKPIPIIKCNGKYLYRNVDYSLSYKNNIKAGTGEIIIKGKNNYTGSKKVTFKIVKPPKPTKKLKLSKTEINLSLAGTKSAKLKLDTKKVSGTVKWKSSNNGVATVANDGEVKAKGTGTAIITVSAGGFKAFCTVNVNDYATETITIIASSLDEWKSKIEKEERRLVFGGELVGYNDGKWYTGNIIYDRKVLSYQEMDAQISENTPGYYKTVHFRLPKQIKYTLHRHNLKNVINSEEGTGRLIVGLFEQTLVWTQKCSCGFENILEWELPPEMPDKLTAEDTYTVQSISRDINS